MIFQMTIEVLQMCIALNEYKFCAFEDHNAILWQKEASDESDISCKRAKCVCHFH